MSSINLADYGVGGPYGVELAGPYGVEPAGAYGVELAGPYGVELAGPYGVELAGPYGVEIAGLGEGQKFLGLQTWQWMFTLGAGVATASGVYAAVRPSRPKKAASSAAIAGLGGTVGGLLFALALGRYA